MTADELFKQLELEKDNFKDLHVLRFFSSFVAVSGGKVIKVTDPFLRYCPLASFLYKGIRKFSDAALISIKKEIAKAVEGKIERFGFFTANRQIHRDDIAVPYGASEILMFALRQKIIEAAVVVCDGAGTVIVNSPETVQGIGARMNGLFYTSPIPKRMEELRKAGCSVVFPQADINQLKGVEKAARSGYKNIAVTINGFSEEKLERILEMERELNISVTSLIVCTTGVSKKRVLEMENYADLVWSCASGKVRNVIGKKSILQLSAGIPVFVLTKKGLDLVAGYASDKQLIRELNPAKQFFVGSRKCAGEKIKMGNFDAYLSEAKLPVNSRKAPKPLV